jgi:hypothetical protein
VSQMSRAIAELQMFSKKLEGEDSQFLLGIANTLTRHSTVLEGRIKERHEAICQLFNQMLGALEEINKAYYAHSVELIDIAASLSARAQFVGSGSLTSEAIEAEQVVNDEPDDSQGPQSLQARRANKPSVVEITISPLDIPAE